MNSQLQFTDHTESQNLNVALQRLVDRNLFQPWSGTIFRCCKLRYARSADLLSGEGARRFGGRFGRPNAYPIVYGSLSAELALRESEETFRKAGIQTWEACPLVIASIHVTLERVVNLRNAKTQEALGFPPESIEEDPWKSANDQGQESLSQAFGRMAYHHQVQALLVPSRLHASDANLVMFRDHVRDDQMEIMGDGGE